MTAGKYLIEMHTMLNLRVIDMRYQYHPQVNHPYSVLENCKKKIEKEIKTSFTGFNTKAIQNGPNLSMPLPPKIRDFVFAIWQRYD